MFFAFIFLFLRIMSYRQSISNSFHFHWPTYLFVHSHACFCFLYKLLRPQTPYPTLTSTTTTIARNIYLILSPIKHSWFSAWWSELNGERHQILHDHNLSHSHNNCNLPWRTKNILHSYTYVAIWIFLSFTAIVYNKYILDRKMYHMAFCLTLAFIIVPSKTRRRRLCFYDSPALYSLSLVLQLCRRIFIGFIYTNAQSSNASRRLLHWRPLQKGKL